jgi:hypothetical protein
MEEQHEVIVGADDYYDKADAFSVLIGKVEKALK